MSDIILSTDETMQFHYHGRKNFFNVNVHHDWAASVWNLDEFNWWLVVKFTDGRYSPHQVICFPGGDWFIDWAKENEGKFVIVYNPQEASDPVEQDKHRRNTEPVDSYPISAPNSKEEHE